MKSMFKPEACLSALAILFVMVVVMVINWDTAYWREDSRVLQNDANQYYAYLPAIFVYHDITLQVYHKDPKVFGPNFFPKRSPTWELIIITTYGVSAMYFPFFIVAHALAPLLGYEATGFSLPYQFAIQMSSWLYLFLGLIFLRKLLLKYFDDKVVAIVLIASTLSTNLLWYVTGEAAMSHIYSFFLITIYLFLIDSWLEKISIRKSIYLGLVIGLIALIRPTNVIIGMLVLLWKVSGWPDLKSRFLFFLRHWDYILLMMCIFALVWLPQLFYWKIIAGTYFYYSYPDEQGFYFKNPQLLNLLFSWRKGWLIYSPVMAFSLIGIGLLYKIKRQFFWPMTIYFLLSWYILSSWWSWWYGGGLGIRPYVDSYGIFSFGQAAFLTWAFRQGNWLKPILFILFSFSLWIGTHNVARYFHGSLHWDGNTKETYLEGFFQVERDSNYWNTVKRPDYDLARKGIYRYEGEAEEEPDRNSKEQ